MLLNNFIQVLLVYVGIPNLFRVHHQHRTFFTPIKATCGIDPYPALTGQAALLNAGFYITPHLQRIMPLTARSTIIALIGAEKDMVTVVGHTKKDTGYRG